MRPSDYACAYYRPSCVARDANLFALRAGMVICFRIVTE